MSDNEFVSVDEAAEKLGISSRRIRQLIEDNELPARRIGRSWLIPASEIHQRKRLSPRRGRPYNKQNVWKLAAFADVLSRQLVDVPVADPLWGVDLKRQQDQVAGQLDQYLDQLREFQIIEVLDNPSRLADLRRLLARAHHLSRREELLAGWIHDASRHIHIYESRARLDSFSLANQWLEALGADPENIESDLSSMRSLKNMLSHRLDHPDRDVSVLRSRFDHAAYFYGHPSLLDELAADSFLACSGERAGAEYGLDLVPAGHVQGYVREDAAQVLVDRHMLQPADRFVANVFLRMVENLPLEHPPVAPRIFVAADLMESDDPRSRDAGSSLLDALIARLSINRLVSRWK